MQSWDHADSECVSYMKVDCKDMEFTNKKQLHSLTH